MDLILNFCDTHFITPYIYQDAVPEDNILRQFTSLWVIVTLSGALLYLVSAALSYHFLFDQTLRHHPRFLKDQERKEIIATLKAVPTMGFLTAIFFQIEVLGYSKLYDDARDHGGFPFIAASFVSFLLFTDFCIYWIHRWLHHPLIYPLHKLHHQWKVPTPFASHAFNPLDGFLQSVPYHIYPFLFPLNKGLYLALFVFVNFWSVSIHDNEFKVPSFLQGVINGCAHHTDHHLYYNYNYGQYTTLWDRLCGSYRQPSAYCGPNVHDVAREHMEKEDAKKK